MDWMLMPLKRYADFSGRSRRKEYWMFFLLNVIVYIIGVAFIFAGMPWDEVTASASNGYGSAEPTPPGVMFWFGVIILGAWVLGTLVPNIAVHVRRFHDQDKSGWMYLINFIPYVGGLIVLVFMFLEGTPGPNRFGHDPKGGDSADIFA